MPGKGELNCLISAQLFTLLEQAGVPTHFRGLLDDGWMLVQPVRMIPLEVVFAESCSGPLCCDSFPLLRGQPLAPPLLDLYFKDDALGDPLLSEARLAILNIIAPQERTQLETMARQAKQRLAPSLAPD